MNKTIAILIFTFFLGCNALAQASQSVPPPDTAAPVVTITQQQFDSLVAAAARGNQMELIAKQEAERMFDIYTTHTSLLLALFGVLITILVGLVGAVFPYMTNKAYKREMDAKIAAHDNSIQDIRDQMEQSEARAQESAIKAEASELFSKALNEKDIDKQILLYTEVISYTERHKLDQQKAAAYNNRGVAYYNRGDYDQAINDYTKAIGLNPQNAEAYNNRGNAYAKKGEYDQAINDYTKAIELNPQDATAYYNRGNAYLNKKEYNKAMQDYNEAIKLNPKYAEAYNNRGNAFFIKGEYDKAIQDYCEVIKLNPKDADAYYNRGLAYSKKKEYDKAIQDYDEAIKLNPQDAKAYNNRGLAYMLRGKEGDYALAKADFEKGLTLNPDEEIRQKLQENLRDVEDKMNGNTDSAPTQ